MYQSTYDIASKNINALTLLFQIASKQTDWCILTAPGNVFNFPGGEVPRPEITVMGNYQYSSYRCPRCGKVLYKTIFPEGNDPFLIFNDQTGDGISPARIFTCPDCFTFYATPKGYHLTDGQVITANCPQTQEGLDLYNMWFEIFNTIGDLNARRME